ncbi:hypothetical protein N7456_006684 [Penicillium angulare]|uniref:CCHC-type domain-containing protein n=1 Tax=Penicillium angulare TaxID=116970 RepID=A0A9W9FI67_9EURO|nr:hypothetical protein N7456_006684 [Penicillium angulare]
MSSAGGGDGGAGGPGGPGGPSMPVYPPPVPADLAVPPPLAILPAPDGSAAAAVPAAPVALGNQGRVPRRREARCWLCRQPGHRKPECPRRGQRAQPNAAAPNNARPPKPPKPPKPAKSAKGAGVSAGRSQASGPVHAARGFAPTFANVSGV